MWDKAKAAVEAVGGCLIPVGKATKEKQVILDTAGEKRVVEARGYEHFKSQK
jgi:thiamine monophosphate kinase